MKYNLTRYLLTIDIKEIDKLAKHDDTLKSTNEARQRLFDYILECPCELCAFEPQEITSEQVEWKFLNYGLWSPETAYYDEISVIWEDSEGVWVNCALIRDSRLDLVEYLLKRGLFLND